MTSAIPGSEIFSSRPVDPDALARALPPTLPVHTVTQQQIDELDPLTYEVIRHRLWSVTDEMGEALKRMSGSPIVTDANDFDFAISDELGQEVQVGLYNTMLVGAVDLAIYWTLQHRATNPGIVEGDMFLCNDPWVGGGLHQSDVIVYQPIFHEGKLFAWTSAICHEPDLGGSGLGSFDPSAKDVFSESLPTPPVKVVRDYELQRDVADLWVRRSRVPMLVGLDLRAKIGANTVGRNRMLAVIEQYGADTVKAVMKRMMTDAEGRLRSKLSSLPDGTWKATGYQDQSHTGDREVHKITVAMSKTDDHLTFDFTGTDKQTGVINCTYAGMRGGVMLALLPILAGDIPWSAGGLMRCFDLVSEEGTINNASFPAAVSRGPIGPAWLTGTLIAECLSQMLDRSVDLGKSVQAACCGTWDTAVIAGLDERGDQPVPFLNIMMEPMAGGYGARPTADGMDTGGLFCIPMGRIPDTEMTEFLYPLLTLWRREEPDSGGPGRQRGGVSASLAVTPYGTSLPMGLVLASAGKAVAQNNGLAGGYPGNTGLEILARSTDVIEQFAAGKIPGALEDLGGGKEFGACYAESYVAPGEVLYMHWQGGGGYGDPLHRDPAAVVVDLREGKVTAEGANVVYGVVIDAGKVDEAATARRRRDMIDERRTRSTQHSDAPTMDLSLARRLDDNLSEVTVGDVRVIACAQCGRLLGDEKSSGVLDLARYEGPSSAAGPQVTSDPSIYVDTPIVFRQLCCPGCWTAVYSGIVPADHPDHSLEISRLLPAVAER
ncbi:MULTISPECIES: hydantoinase B/oxoprolinase family protein [unclassified Rhodococcus (in: high G+C Gram-positive bacteria)]|uniref:hydantoinase B/oxoprolinase family protein n=1 Tax=unclassified Rhodococcus (in: high G+C Gram-positive bacteria) TaxID=192944 RepID=UPI0007BC62CD|nr:MULTISPECIES: hydantoinase B/oxoprolinase family protein [unclassified Rhodococcus (in: high G+C Gram-positive bacteria)]KZF03099.1 hydantoinase [Rhodococcus sp. EPR-279]OZE17822.1 hydantoinase [Rhodococcus sp. 05-2254-6]OZE37675.1 hydantoinase [Rhodococcus sp. 05-2254-4]OZE40807.1 hydantoinase [Rhodococcus sp. 05-2254-3]OZE45798.1 hydantoinase [Rhodococcus sp. 05-2254-2]